MSEVILEPGRVDRNYWLDLWRYRELLFFLTWRDVKVRYKQTYFGAAWAVLQPLANMIVLSILFSGVSGKLAASSCLRTA